MGCCACVGGSDGADRGFGLRGLGLSGFDV